MQKASWKDVVNKNMSCLTHHYPSYSPRTAAWLNWAADLFRSCLPSLACSGSEEHVICLSPRGARKKHFIDSRSPYFPHRTNHTCSVIEQKCQRSFGESFWAVSGNLTFVDTNRSTGAREMAIVLWERKGRTATPDCLQNSQKQLRILLYVDKDPLQSNSACIDCSSCRKLAVLSSSCVWRHGFSLLYSQHTGRIKTF